MFSEKNIYFWKHIFICRFKHHAIWDMRAAICLQFYVHVVPFYVMTQRSNLVDGYQRFGKTNAAFIFLVFSSQTTRYYDPQYNSLHCCENVRSYTVHCCTTDCHLQLLVFCPHTEYSQINIPTSLLILVSCHVYVLFPRVSLNIRFGTEATLYAALDNSVSMLIRVHVYIYAYICTYAHVN
jgi:hypothetical protein